VSNKSIILGDAKEVTVKVHISNLQNPAYGAAVKLTSSSNAAYSDSILGDGSVLVVCNSTMDTSSTTCEFERPFFKQQTAVFSSYFNVSSEHMLSSHGVTLDKLKKDVIINITTQVRMPSIETDESNNQISKMLDVKLKSEIEITRYDYKKWKAIHVFTYISIPTIIYTTDKSLGFYSCCILLDISSADIPHVGDIH